ALIVRIALVGPVQGKIRGEEEDAEFCKAEIVQRGESGAEVRAAVHRTATAIDDQLGGAGQRGGPRLEFLQAHFIPRHAMILRALDVAGSVKAVEAHKDNRKSGFRVVEFFQQVRRLNGLQGGPRVSRGAQRSVRDQQQSRGEREEDDEGSYSFEIARD